MKQLIVKDIIKQKEDFIAHQNNKCAICESELDSDLSKVHLDHDHELHNNNAGKCRGALCMFCNRLEGEIKKKFMHSGLVSRDNDQLNWLKSLISYLEKDLSKRNIHPQHMSDYCKWFNRQNKCVMIDELHKIGVEPPNKCTQADLRKLFKKEFRKFQKTNYTDYEVMQ